MTDQRGVDDLVDDGLVGQALGFGDKHEHVLRGQRRKRIDLQHVGVSRAIHADVHPPEVQALHRQIRLQRHRLQRLAQVLADRGRADVIRPGTNVLESIEQPPELQRSLDPDLHDRLRLRRVVADDGDRKFAALDEFFHERRLPVGVNEPLRLLRERLGASDQRGLAHALAGALVARLHDQRIGQVDLPALFGIGQLGELGGGNAVGDEDLFREDLVERQAEGQAVAADERHAQHLQDDRHLRLAVAPLLALGDVEDQVHRLRQVQALQELPGVAEAHHLMPARPDRVLDHADGVVVIELRVGVRRITRLEDVLAFDVIGQANAH